ncbi:MAG: hypothetical protein RL338_1634 [Chloroflexota bacterium]|jgi:hypothetical protein
MSRRRTTVPAGPRALAALTPFDGAPIDGIESLRALLGGRDDLLSGILGDDAPARPGRRGLVGRLARARAGR